jgi:tetratricopeptide (TPR) repeat protein
MSIRIKKLGRQNLGIALFNLNLGLSLSFAGVANARMGDMINMKKNLKKAIKLLSLAPNYEDKQDKYDRLTILAMSQAAFGLREAAITNIKKVLTLEPIDFCYRCHYYHLTLLAQIYALYNDADDAIPLLKKVIAAKGTGRSISEFLLKNDPGWDPIRSDPRFQELVRNYSDKKQQM